MFKNVILKTILSPCQCHLSNLAHEITKPGRLFYRYLQKRQFHFKRAAILTKMTRYEFEQKTHKDMSESELQNTV